MSGSGPTIRVLVEDDGLAEFLDRTLDLTLLRLVSVEVIACGGWTGVFSRYSDLVQSGYDLKQIVPVLDADTIEERLPREQTVLDNPNLFRLSYDLEFAFENWMLAEALIQLQCSPFNDDQSPRNYLECERLVQKARATSVQEEGTLYQHMERLCREEYASQGREPTEFVPPSKMQLALAVAEIVCRTYEFPTELAALIKKLEDIAEVIGFDLSPPHLSLNSVTLHTDVIETAKLSGKILVSLPGQQYPHVLWLIDLDRQELRPIADGKIKMAWASWSPNGKLIAGQSPMHTLSEHKRLSVLIIDESGVEKSWVSTRTPIGAEADPCWYPDGLSLILRTGEGTTVKVSQDAKRWKTLYRDTGHHCVSRNGRIARAIYRENHYLLLHYRTYLRKD